MNKYIPSLFLLAAASLLWGCDECLEFSSETAVLSADDVEYAIGDADPYTACEELCLEYGYNSIESCETLEVREDGSVTAECSGEPACK